MKSVIDSFFKDKLFERRTSFCSILEKYKSDKSTWHNYSTIYDYIFNALDLKNSAKNIFEMGLGTNNVDVKSNMGSSGNPGASLLAFREVFKNANMYGADIDKRILFQTDRINTFYCDQTSSEDIKTLWEKIPVEFDIIIDDGLHEAYANIIFLDNSFHKLRSGGIFIIEDIMNTEIDIISAHIANFDCSYSSVLTLPMEYSWTESNPNFRGRKNNYDNNLAILVKR